MEKKRTNAEKIDLCKKHVEWFALCGAICFVGVLFSPMYAVGALFWGLLSGGTKVLCGIYEKEEK